MKRTLACLALLLAAQPALADDTALNDGRFGPEPIGGGITGAESAIRMVREDLRFTVGRKQCTVVARFVFESSLDVPARQLVGFPDIGAAQREATRRDPSGEKIGFYEVGTQGPIQAMQTRVDGRPVTSTLKYGLVDGSFEKWHPSKNGKGYLMAWYAMWVDFPPHKPVVVERRYRTAAGGNVLGQTIFDYVVASGGVWKGTIGELVADATLVDGLTTRDLAWGLKPEQGHSGYPARSAWQVVSPTHLKLVWKDFEPRGTTKYDHVELVTLPTLGSDGKPLKQR